jgi:hypothetical protein
VSKPDWFNLIAAERGLPAGWTWFRSEWRGEGDHAVMLVNGGIPGGVFTRGKNKGKPNPAKRTNVCELVVTRDDCDCFGTGQRVVGWSKDGGAKHRACVRCAATRQEDTTSTRAADEGEG